jgi:hypothetical protein
MTFDTDVASPRSGRCEPLRFDFARSSADCHDRPSVCRDPGEHLALALVRYVCAGYMTASADCWEAAHACADDTFGPVDGPSFVARASALVRALRAERQLPFAFFPASCGRMSRDEVDLITLLHAARRDDAVRLERQAARMTGGASSRRTILAARALAVLLDRHAFLMAAERAGLDSAARDRGAAN